MLPIEFNSHKFSFMWYVFVEISGFFSWPQWPQNDPKITPKMRKVAEILKFWRFNATFLNFSFFNKARINCSVRFYEKINAFFSYEKDLKLTSKMTRTENFPFFEVFMQYLSNFRHTPWIGMFQRVKKERFHCPVVVYEAIIAVFQWKMSQIDTENDKKHKIFQF